MYVKSIVLEGFKSYGQRTVIEGFDCEFNAITGLNGTGKSNILDSICFVLGISQLNNVRVTCLQDLVYRSGQAGITKATVSITFDNRNKSSSPVGFENYDEIVVTRQVVMGGKNKYLINGVNVNNKRVQDLFCSVQLNVNNPHFLIMQGRITKVLNMKPPEILSMVEEAAGTKMYDVKKSAAQKSIEKKDAKLKEINHLCSEELIPKLNKLREERKMYLEFQRIERELENLSAMYLAWKFIQTKKVMKQNLDDLETKQGEVKQIEESIEQYKQKTDSIEKEVEEHEQKNTSNNVDIQQFESSVKEKEKLFAKASAAENSAKDNISAEESKKNQVLKTLKDDQALLNAKQSENSNMCETFQKLKDAEAADRKAFETAQKKYEALIAGKEIGDDGQAATLQEQLMKANEEAVEAATAVKQATIQLQHNETQLKKKQQDVGALATNFKTDKTNMENLEKDLTNLTKQLQSLNFQEDQITVLRDSKRNLMNDCRIVTDKMERFQAQYPQIDFVYADPEPNFNRRSVKGLVCNLFCLKDPTTFATAFEVAAGSRLFNVVTDTEITSKKLLQFGQLQHRTTIIPLNQIRGNPIQPGTIQYAKSLVGQNNVFPALSLIEYSNESKLAMEYIYGSIFICKDLDTARIIAFDKQILRKCVTLDGDVVEPAGTLSGGARRKGTPFLLVLEDYKKYQAELSAKSQELSKLEAQIKNIQTISDKYHEIKQKCDIRSHEFNVVKNRLQQTSYYQQQEEINNLKKEIVELNESIKVNKEKEKLFVAAAKKIQQEINNSNKEQKVKQAEIDMKRIKKQFENSKNCWREKEQYYESLKLEISELENAIVNEQEQIKLCEENMISLQKELEEATKVANEAKAVAVKYQSELKEKKTVMNSKNKEIHKKLKEKTELLNKVAEMKIKIKKKTNEIEELEKNCHSFRTQESELKKKVKDGDTRLKDAEKMSNSEGQELGRRITKSQEHRNKLSRNINVKAQRMFEQEEKQYGQLMKKKTIIENDRRKLLALIADMDEKKILFLQTAVEQICKDFGSIFGTLLPGSSAKISPPLGKTILDGLEFKVKIGGIWKDDLNELSGGQKSLVALSLILAMLLFKPAPIYILDEVDAALDLSHTQNIGKMLRMHFKQSQFIIVSLKDGMFNNANVLFRTRFVDGMSTVSRLVNENRR